jgi:asparagine synthase (glutamine-hydrolysing)
MCGIVGILYKDGRTPDEALVRAMAGTLAHRGPDGEGFKILPGCGLGHRRLSIIDLEGGAQPMANEDESIWVALNGEIYNFLDLRSELEARGHRWRTRSDTEAIVHLYEEMGSSCVTRLRGMFAFGLWDAPRRRLLLARDRIGKKPLYYFEDADGLCFASEIKALLALPNCPTEVDPEAIDLYLAYQSVPGTKTIFKGVKRLPPGSILVWTPESGTRIERYWELDWTKKTNLSYEDAKRRLRELILEATRIRLIADVPLGSFLSGGVDSSVVVSAMAEVSDAPIRTFSVGFPQKDFDETRYARIVAEKFGTRHEELMIEPRAMEILPKLAWHYDQPYADSSALPTYYVCQAARQRVTVALNGDGGDEFFGGYDRYRALLYHRLYHVATTEGLRGGLERLTSWIHEGAKNRSLARRITRFARAGRATSDRFNLALFQYFDQEHRRELYAPEFAARLGGHDADRYLIDLMEAGGSMRHASIIDRALRADTLGYLPDTLLVKVDVASMAVGLEGRSPLLDASILEFAASLPSNWKVGYGSSKRILKEAHHGIVPHEVMYRRKMGFSIPIAHWFRGELYDYLREHILDPRALGRGYFRRAAVEKLIDEHKSGYRNNANRLWALLMLELWHREILEKREAAA